MKWKNRMAELGLNDSNISAGLKKKISTYYTIQNGLAQAQQALQNAGDDDDVEDLQDDVTELEDALEAADDKLVRDVDIFDKNKERYVEMAKHLGKGRPRKNPLPAPAPQPKPAPTPTPTPTPTPAPQPTPTPAPQPTPTPTPTPTPKPKDDDKKSSGFGFVLAAIVVGVITFGAVQLSKNR